MLARGWRQAGFAVSWLLLAVADPAQAGWDYYSHPIMYSFARQAMRQAIMYELHRLNAPQRSHPSEQSTSKPQRSSTVSAHHGTSSSHATAYGATRGGRDRATPGLRYPTEDKLVPPPPPYEPALYPPESAQASRAKSPSGASPTVPPPPPAPSVWNDVQNTQN